MSSVRAPVVPASEARITFESSYGVVEPPDSFFVTIDFHFAPIAPCKRFLGDRHHVVTNSRPFYNTFWGRDSLGVHTALDFIIVTALVALVASLMIFLSPAPARFTVWAVIHTTFIINNGVGYHPVSISWPLNVAIRGRGSFNVHRYSAP